MRKKVVKIGAFLGLLVLFLSGCGGSSSSGTTTNPSTTDTQKGESQSTAVTADTSSAAQGSTDTVEGSVGEAQGQLKLHGVSQEFKERIAKGKQASLGPFTISCKSGSKTLTVTQSATDLGTVTLDVDNTNCVTGFDPSDANATCSSGTDCAGMLANGKVSIGMTNSSWSSVVSTGYFSGVTSSTITYSNSYSSRTATVESGKRTEDTTISVSDNATAKVDYSPDLGTQMNTGQIDFLTVTLNGTWTLVENLSGFTQKAAFSSYSIKEEPQLTDTDGSVTGTASTKYDKFTDNGSLTMTWGSSVVASATFTDYVTNIWQETVSSKQVDKRTENGTIKVSNSCLDDTLTVKTTTAILDDPSQTCYTDGTVEITGASGDTGKVVYLSDGSTEIWYNNSKVETVACGEDFTSGGCTLSKLQVEKNHGLPYLARSVCSLSKSAKG